MSAGGSDRSREAQPLIVAVDGFLRRHGIRDRKIVVAVSGGADSVALLHALHSLREAHALDLHVAHLDHGLRGDAGEKDARFVGGLASSLSLPFTTEPRDVAQYRKTHKLSLEDAARRVRHRFLEDVADAVGAQHIALGHTADDQAETVLLQLVRGTGLAGLRGMRPRRERIIRPLLEAGRPEIESYLEELGASFVVDETNLDLAFARNRMRHEILPLLREHFNPRVVEAVARTAGLVDDVDHWVDSTVEKILADSTLQRDGEGLRLRVTALTRIPQFLRLTVVLRAVEEVFGEPSGLESKHLLAVDQLLRPSTARGEVTLPNGIRACRRGDDLELTRKKGDRGQDWEMEIEVPGSLHAPGSGIEILFETAERRPLEGGTPFTPPYEAYLDLDALRPPLILRNRRDGDRFHPLGAPGSRKLKDFFIDEKVPRESRDGVPLLVDQEGIICVLGFIIGQRVRITDETRRHLHIVMSRTGADPSSPMPPRK